MFRIENPTRLRRGLLVPCLLVVVAFASCSSERSQPTEAAAQKTRTPGGGIAVAFVIAKDAEVVDFSGPWGVFEYVTVPDREDTPFTLYTVAESTAPLRVSGGLQIIPDYSFANAPPPKVIVVPALGADPSPAMLAWLQKQSTSTELTMSVCNGAFVLAKAGLLAGKSATAHHGGYGLLAANFPDVTVRRGARFVDAGNVATAGGLTSGIDLALHVVERKFGRDVAEKTALSLEYQGQGWKNPDSNAVYAQRPVSTPEHPICPVCEMEVDKTTALTGDYRGQKIFFCSAGCRKLFEASPERFPVP